MSHEDFLNLLHEEHEEIKEMLQNLEEAGEESTDKEELFEELKMALVPHMKAEEKTFYALLKEDEDSREDALEALEEHHASDLIFQELNKLSKQDEVWDAKLKVFKEMVEHHIEEEESKIFEDSRKVLSHEEVEDLKERYLSAKESIKVTGDGRGRKPRTTVGRTSRSKSTNSQSSSRSSSKR